MHLIGCFIIDYLVYLYSFLVFFRSYCKRFSRFFIRRKLLLDTNSSIGKLYNLSEWLIRYLKVNLLWFIFNIPIVFLLLNLLIVKSTNEIISISIVIFALLPFLFFPATTSLFAVIRECFKNSEDIPIVRSFLIFYKENYVRSMTGGLVIGVIWIIFIVDYYYFTVYVSELFFYFFILLFTLLISFTLHFFSVTVHFESKLFKALKNSILVTIASPILSILLGVLTVLFVYLSFNYITFIIPLFMGSLISIVSYRVFYKTYLKI